MVIEVKFGY